MKIFSSNEQVERAIKTLSEMERAGGIDPQYARIIQESLQHSYKAAVKRFWDRLAEEGLVGAFFQATQKK